MFVTNIFRRAQKRVYNLPADIKNACISILLLIETIFEEIAHILVFF